jgi:5-methylcytosine-specific restriction endonuclease McrA
MHSKDLYPPKAKIKNPRFCICGTQLPANKRYCSIACQPLHPYKPRVSRLYHCETCHIAIVMSMGGPKRWCSRVCYRQSVEWRTLIRMNRARRKARERGNPSERIDPYVVFERDQWRCQACGHHTSGTLRGSHHSRAPELDHIIPLARGGSHTYANVQCLCRACNQQKGASVKEEQRLIGWSNYHQVVDNGGVSKGLES